MARPNVPRALSLPEELEKLEQQITLTLQEIDSNFSKAHRIVTSSILPIVEQYSRHSNDVWEGSKFWKQFFEASANVSLSGYEEPAIEDDATRTDDTSTSLHTPTDHGEQSASGADLSAADEDDDFSVDSPTQVTGTQSTPKLSLSAGKTSTGAGSGQSSRPHSAYRSPSPRKYTGKSPFGPDHSQAPSTPRQRAQKSETSSPFEPISAFKPGTTLNPQTNHNNDPLMHRVLDKNYRIQATPHAERQKQTQRITRATPTTATKTKTQPWDDSPGSSPIDAAPQLRTELFSPAKARTPGISVLTPRYNKSTTKPRTSTGRQLFSPQDKTHANTQRTRTSQNVFTRDFDDDDDEEDTTDMLGGMSPPKTMQFHIPQSRLVQTPAREASRRIVEDLLLTAGAEDTDEIEEGFDFTEEALRDDYDEEEGSPSMVRGGFDREATF